MGVEAKHLAKHEGDVEWQTATKRELAECIQATDPQLYQMLAKLGERFGARAVVLECDEIRWTDETA